MARVDPSNETERDGAIAALRELERKEQLIQEERRRLDDEVRRLKLQKKMLRKMIAAGESGRAKPAGTVPFFPYCPLIRAETDDLTHAR
jgi:hypothetical protein